MVKNSLEVLNSLGVREIRLPSGFDLGDLSDKTVEVLADSTEYRNFYGFCAQAYLGVLESQGVDRESIDRIENDELGKNGYLFADIPSKAKNAVIGTVGMSGLSRTQLAAIGALRKEKLGPHAIDLPNTDLASTWNIVRKDRDLKKFIKTNREFFEVPSIMQRVKKGLLHCFQKLNRKNNLLIRYPTAAPATTSRKKWQPR